MQLIAVHNSTYLESPEGSKAMPDKGECWGVGPLYSVKGATMGACEGECWGGGLHAQWKGLPWGVLVQVVSLCQVEGATMGACEGECWGVSSGGLPVPSSTHPLRHIMQR